MNRSLHILYANTTVDDIICPKYLLQLVAASNETLTITHILSEKPGHNWNGLTGYINQKVLFEWMLKHHAPIPPSTPRENKRKPLKKIISSPTIIPSTPTTPLNSKFSFDNNNADLNDHRTLSTSTISTSKTKSDQQINKKNGRKRSIVAVDDAIFEIISNNDSATFMKDFAEDPRAIKLVVCGPHQFMNTIAECLGSLNFPKDKTLFIN